MMLSLLLHLPSSDILWPALEDFAPASPFAPRHGHVAWGEKRGGKREGARGHIA